MKSLKNWMNLWMSFWKGKNEMIIIYEYEEYGFIFFILVQLILILLKVASYIFWPWWIVLIPLWIFLCYLQLKMIFDR